MPPRPRTLTALAIAAVGAAALATTAVAPVPSDTTYAYDAATHVLRLRVGAGVTGQIEPASADGQYVVSASGGAGLPWANTGDALPTGSVISYSDGMGNEVLTIQGAHDGVSGVDLSKIALGDNTGPVTWIVKGDTPPPNHDPNAYRDPIQVDPANAASLVRVANPAGPIAFGSTSLSINAPDVRIEQDISSSQSLALASPAPIVLTKAVVSLSASAGVSSTTIAGNGNDLVVHGPWWAAASQGGTTAIAGAHEISVDGALHPSADLTATAPITVSGDIQPVPSTAPTLTAPAVYVGGAIAAGNAPCGLGGIQGCGVGAAGTGTGVTLATPDALIGSGVTLNGVVGVRQDQWSGTTRLRGGVDQPGGSLQVGGTLLVGGTAAMTLRTGLLATDGGLVADTHACGASRTTCGSIDEATPWVPTRDVVVDAGEWATAFTAYMPGSLTATGPVTVAPPDTPGGYVNASLQSDGVLDLRGGVHVPIYGSMTVTGSPAIVAGATSAPAAGSLDPSDIGCNPGPLLSTSDLRVTAPIECLSTLMSTGNTWLGADVTTVAHQAYDGPVTVALGDGPRRLRAGGDAGVGFHQGVSAAWGPTPGAAGYVATAGASSCRTDATVFTCALDPTPSGNDIMFAMESTLAQAAAPNTHAPARNPGPPLPSGRTTRRSVGKGSHTTLTALIVPPKSRGKRTWAERGPCRIMRGRLVAPAWAGTCTVTLKVARSGRTKAWRGRAIVDVS